MDLLTGNDSLPFREAHKIEANQVALVNKDVSDYFAHPCSEDSEPWKLKPEIPSPEEVMGTDDDYVDLVPNKISGAWGSKEDYLKAHYELLREDAVAPLRDAVAVIKNDPKMMDNRVVSIYDKVYVIGITFASRGLAFRIRFSTSRAGKKIAWDYSKRLVSGSIVALSPADDVFQNKCVIAIVAARPLEGVKLHPPEIDIFFARPEDANFDPQLEWIMVEAKDGYYESARHTLMALQKLSQERFPLAEHICSLDPNVDAPGYVEDNPVVDMQPAVSNDLGEECKVDILKRWPQNLGDGLDETQWAALGEILTKSLAVIQGPPGTGKTYLSVIALKIMLSNMKANDPPIIISSQTNHALDQILRYISQFEEKYIRLGSRSSDPDIKKRTLFAIREREPAPNIHGGAFPSAKKHSKTLTNSICELLQPFNAGNSDTPLLSSSFMEYNLLTQAQYDSLEKGSKRWIRADDKGENTDPLLAWLEDQAAEFEVVYRRENFGFAEDEIDLEYEQLKELEAEQGLEDDDYERLRGQFLGLREGYYGRDVSNTKTTCMDFLKQKDMWEIPVKERGKVYNILREQLKTKIMANFRQLLVKYVENCRILQIGKWERDYLILQDAKIIGTTATGLNKYRGLISTVKPKVVLIEEAAEAIEAPIAAACFDTVQQLILVGDHQQLRGHCSVRELEGEPFFLDVSMFERLVKNGIQYVTLRRQRRMAPEIRQLLEPIYGSLEDHKSVQKRATVPGMGEIRTFFFSHSWPESADGFASKFNEKEAEMVVGFFVYLVLNDVPVNDITILTFYNGQRKKLLKLLKNHPYLQGHYVKVVTVDSYQGEENEIVILSLVRNGKNNIGFLSTENRVCVALSRARRGFYLFGNAESLARADALWFKVLHIMGNKDSEPRVGFSLPLTCVKHKNKIFKKDPAEWNQGNGGCQEECGEKLICGHKCSLQCHSFSHDKVQCTEICNRRMACSDICKTPCATTHVCSCNCEESKRLRYVREMSYEDNHSTYDERNAKQGNSCDTAIQNYQAFANGGSRQQDALLAKKAQSMQRQRELKFGSFTGGLGSISRQTGFDENHAGAAKAHREFPGAGDPRFN